MVINVVGWAGERHGQGAAAAGGGGDVEGEVSAEARRVVHRGQRHEAGHGDGGVLPQVVPAQAQGGTNTCFKQYWAVLVDGGGDAGGVVRRGHRGPVDVQRHDEPRPGAGPRHRHAALQLYAAARVHHHRDTRVLWLPWKYCVEYCPTFIPEQRVVSQQLFPLELSMNLHEVSVPQKCTSASMFKVTTFTNKTLTLCKEGIF